MIRIYVDIHVFLLLAVMLASIVLIIPSASASGVEPPEDTSYVMIDDYWNMSLNGKGLLIYGGTKYGHGPSSGKEGYVIDSDGNITWGCEVDRKWVQFARPMYGVWDLGEPYFEVVVFPQQDHGPYPQEALEYKIWGSNSFDLNNPEDTVWVPADLERVYVKGWSNIGETPGETCNDDYVAVWDFNGTPYRYVKLLSIWAPPYNEPEIDAVKGVSYVKAQIEVNSPCHTLNLKSDGKWVTVYIELGEGYDVRDINISSIRMNGDVKVDPAGPVTIGDYNGNGVSDLMVKFRKEDVVRHILNSIGVPYCFVNFTVGVTGNVGGVMFGGYAVIRVTWPSSSAFSKWFDFGTVDSPVEPGYVQVTSGSVFSNTIGYGWDYSNSLFSRNRDGPDSLRRDFVFSSIKHSFKVNLAKGQYLVLVIMGDENYMHDNMYVYMEGILKANVSTNIAEFKIEALEVTVTDGCLDIIFEDGGGSDPNWVVNGIQIEEYDSKAIRFDFGTPYSPIELGYKRADPSTAYSKSKGYGWIENNALYSRDRGLPSDLCRDFVFSSFDKTFQVDLPNGEYRVHIIVGDQWYMHDRIDVYAENSLAVNDLTVRAGLFVEEYFTVVVKDGQLNLKFHDDGGTDPNWVINALIIDV